MTDVKSSQVPRLKKEVLAVYGVTLLVTGGLALLQGSIGWLRGYLLAIAAGTFIYLPLEVLHRQGMDPQNFGIHSKEIWRALKIAMIVCAIVFPPYLVGFHYWQTQWLKNPTAVSAAHFDSWPIEVQDQPRVRSIELGDVWIYAHRDRFVVRWHLSKGQNISIDVSADVAPTSLSKRVKKTEKGLSYTRGSKGFVQFRANGQQLELDLKSQNNRIQPEQIRLGTALVKADDSPVRLHRSYWWLINLILVQFLLVALPEELFYRGYLQSRLDQIVGRETKVFGTSVNVTSIFITSVLFAIGHFITVPSIYRLGVFFPSLLFGWMRRASDGIMAPLIFHALCNLIVTIASQFYAI